MSPIKTVGWPATAIVIDFVADEMYRARRSAAEALLAGAGMVIEMDVWAVVSAAALTARAGTSEAPVPPQPDNTKAAMHEPHSMRFIVHLGGENG